MPDWDSVKKQARHGTQFFQFLTEVAQKKALIISALNVPTLKAVC